jgi:hypothetical protein
MEEVELLARRKRYEDELTFMKEANIVVANPDNGYKQAKADFIAAIHTLSGK